MMDVFQFRNRLLDDYRRYATSFMRFRDERIRTYVEEALDSGKLWPHPKIGLNPAFESDRTIDDLVADCCIQVTRTSSAPVSPVMTQ